MRTNKLSESICVQTVCKSVRRTLGMPILFARGWAGGYLDVWACGRVSGRGEAG